MRLRGSNECYGGDAIRKRLDKQKEGKKRMRPFGRVEILQEAFVAALKMDGSRVITKPDQIDQPIFLVHFRRRKCKLESPPVLRTVKLYDAKTHLSTLVEEAAAGEEIIIARNGVPKARLSPVVAEQRKPRVPMNAMGIT